MSPKAKQPSKMAEAAAAVRAAHLIYEQSVIFDDPYALRLTSPGWRFIAQNRWLFQLIVKRLMHVLRPAHGQVLARSRYSEDRLLKAMATGISQYVILGAGLDSFALRRRDLSAAVNVYEIDHPRTQQLKKSRLASLGIEKPANVAYIAADFERQTIADLLLHSTFDPQQPAFFSWLGTVPYLSRDAFGATLRSIADWQQAGVEIVFDYAHTVIPPDERQTVATLMKFAERRGEPLITQFDAQTLDTELAAMGYECIENISLSEWRLHYYATPELADLRPISAAYMAHISKS
ncbi:MAG: class I SAM-dependent methyltransferase [Chloroflexi bacterium]|nr:class I SAM-dependent methyltransferase [Chloroflexota bacterium]